MNLVELQAKLMGMLGATEEMPFGPDVLVYKVGGKVFALVSWNATPLRVSLKCRPAHALELRAEFAGVLPGYHLNKQHWNTVLLDGSVPAHVVDAMIDESYGLVVKQLPKRTRMAWASAGVGLHPIRRRFNLRPS